MVEIVDVVFPVRNEASCIAEVLESIHAQILDGRYEFHVCIIPNACTDQTSAIARSTIKRMQALNPRVELRYNVIDRAEPGKNATLNAALAASKTRLFMYGDGDITLTPNCFTAIADRLQEDGAIISGPVPRDLIPDDTEPAIAKLHTITGLLQKALEMRGHDRPPVVMLGFHRTILDEIPITAYSDNLYVLMRALEKHGLESLRIASEASAFQIAPRTATDYINRELRVEANNNSVLELCPEFIPWYDEVYQHYPKSVQEANELLLPLLAEAEISHAELEEWHTMQAKIVNAPDVKEFLRPDGTWAPIESTKRPIKSRRPNDLLPLS